MLLLVLSEKGFAGFYKSRFEILGISQSAKLGMQSSERPLSSQWHEGQSAHTLKAGETSV